MNRRIAAVSLLLLVVLAGSACTTGGIDPDRQFDDAVIATQVRNAIETDASLAGSSISVSVDRGVVTLRGTVRGPAEMERAGTVASGVAGVVSVRNELSVL